MGILCKLGIHKFAVVSQPTKAYGLNGEYIHKIKVRCKRCGEARLKVLRK